LNLVDLLGRIEDQIDANLRELCPEFKLQAKGYRLPLPRIRELIEATGIKDGSPTEPTTVADALGERSRLLVKIPRNYPDNSLAWVIADELLTAELGGKQVVPIVIDGNEIRPPKHDFESQFNLGRLDELIKGDGQQLVFIIDGIPYESKTRLALLIDETERYDAKYIFVIRDQGNAVAETEFASKIGLHGYSVVDNLSWNLRFSSRRILV
jgi:hypothetical protein